MPAYNLIIIQVPKRQQLSDFLTIRNMMYGRATDIDVHVLSVAEPPPAGFWPKMAERPSLIFSPIPVPLDPRLRGARLMAAKIPKSEELRRLRIAGLPVPETLPITPDLRLDAGKWGPFTVIKPDVGYRGRGVALKRTRFVRWTDTSRLPEDDPRRGRLMLAQRYIHTGSRTCCYRVMTVLGRIIYAMRSLASADAPRLDPDGADDFELEVAANGVARRLDLIEDTDILALAHAVAAKLTYVPVFGIDIIREEGTGRLYVLELNSSGRTWHLSSDHGLGHQRDHGLDYYGQFDALGQITDALIEATRKLAV